MSLYMRVPVFGLIFVLLFFALAGCTTGEPSRSTPSVVDTITSEAPKLITPALTSRTIKPSETPLSNKLQTPPPLETPASAMVQQSDEIPTCLNNGEPTVATSVLGFHLEGTILFNQKDFTSLRSISGDIKNPDKAVLSGGHNFRFYGISPSGKWLAISPNDLEGNKKTQPTIFRIRLISNIGQQMDTQTDLSHLTAYVQSADKALQFVNIGGSWLNDDTMALKVYFNNGEPDSTMFMTLPAYLNPFTGEWLDKNLDPLVGKDPYQDMLSWVSLSPDMSRAVRTLSEGMTLWDLKLQREVKIRDEIRSTNFIWSPDSQWAVLYDSDTKSTKIVDRNGEKVTEFDPKIEAGADLRVQTYQYSWSPDSHRLAMIGVVENGNFGEQDATLLIYDLKQQKYVLKCFTHDPHSIPDVQWSPDGEYVTLSNILKPIRVIDLKSREVYELPEEGEVIGWVSGFSLKKAE